MSDIGGTWLAIRGLIASLLIGIGAIANFIRNGREIKNVIVNTMADLHTKEKIEDIRAGEEQSEKIVELVRIEAAYNLGKGALLIASSLLSSFFLVQLARIFAERMDKFGEREYAREQWKRERRALLEDHERSTSS